VLVATDTVDDAGVYLLDDETAWVFTVDLFTPIVDDARDFGRIAAANAVSDVYAMGGRPLLALNIVCFPDGELPMSVMTEIVLGGQEKMEEAGTVIIGGHSLSDRELKYGLAVLGVVHPERTVRNTGARPGDVLVLTKPIGTGVLTTALKYERLSPDAMGRVTATMLTLNRAAAEAMVEARATAATDVTGFGLVGHAVTMAQASGVTLKIDVGRVPLIEGALDAVRSGFRPGGLLSNQHYYRRFVRLLSRADGCTLDLMSDPQTSGGLLIALPEGRLAAFDEALARAGGGERWVIGRAEPRGEKAVVLS